MPKKKDNIIDASTIDIGEAWHEWDKKTWYNVFVTMFLRMTNAEIQQYADNVVDAIYDAQSIATVKHYYENNDRTVDMRAMVDD